MSNFCHLVLEIESLFPFLSSDLRENQTISNTNRNSNTFSFGPNASNLTLGQSTTSQKSMLAKSRAFYGQSGTGLFNWEQYFADLETQSNSELKNNLLKYGLK